MMPPVTPTRTTFRRSSNMMLYADPAQTDAAFLARLFLLLPPEKQSAIAHIRHFPSRRESILGWGLLLYAWRLKTGEQTLPPLGFSERGKPFFKDAATAYREAPVAFSRICKRRRLRGRPTGWRKRCSQKRNGLFLQKPPTLRGPSRAFGRRRKHWSSKRGRALRAGFPHSTLPLGQRKTAFMRSVCSFSAKRSATPR